MSSNPPALNLSNSASHQVHHLPEKKLRSPVARAATADTQSIKMVPSLFSRILDALETIKKRVTCFFKNKSVVTPDRESHKDVYVEKNVEKIEIPIRDFPGCDFVYNKPIVSSSVKQTGSQTEIVDFDDAESSSDAEFEKLVRRNDASDELNQAELFGNQIYV